MDLEREQCLPVPGNHIPECVEMVLVHEPLLLCTQTIKSASYVTASAIKHLDYFTMCNIYM